MFVFDRRTPRTESADNPCRDWAVRKGSLYILKPAPNPAGDSLNFAPSGSPPFESRGVISRPARNPIILMYNKWPDAPVCYSFSWWPLFCQRETMVSPEWRIAVVRSDESL